MFDIEALVGSSHDDIQANLIEIYNAQIMDNGSSHSFTASICGNGNDGAFKNVPGTTMVEYYYQDLVYLYDKSNDAQKVLRRVPISSSVEGTYYAFVFNEENLPCHRFPCTNDIDTKRTFVRKTSRFNNRISIVNEVDTSGGASRTYLVYRHSSMVDLKKISADIECALLRLR